MVAVSLLSGLARAAEDGGYQPYSPSGAEEVSAPLHVVIAYSAIWVVLVGFVLSVFRRQRRVELEIERLRRELGAGR
jgi:CcmD family protein